MKVDAAIIGSGNIGTDLLYKALRSPAIRPRWMVGIDPASDGLARARGLGLRTTAAGVDGLVAELGDVRLAFDATSAHAHARTSALLRERGVVVVDLTPAALGPFCVPPVNLAAHAGEPEVSMVTCGGQATIPIVAAVARVQPVAYAEIVATVASRSVGPGTRQNIDEFTRTTAGAIERVGGARRGKAIIIINPAEPPLIMRDTIHCLCDEEPRREEVAASLAAMIADVQGYVPGYRLVSGPIFDGLRVTVSLEVAGLGDYLPRYAGNLDIMTAAALRTAEMLVEARGWI